ncbi:hypothetical protein D0T49_04335 [Paludibacter sp. 221]|uniref:hypothetical protein n=1 Tax=Paludibacter sp. 221 TaxID=2302939 RepID=UPI0013D5785F|nr:hypothetical protein [Paludibacter sp. 221]NDV46268.1 hypothetical protein [Paludibacter sp. 221]
MNEITTYTDKILLDLFDFLSWSKWLFILAFALTIADLRFGILASKAKKIVIKRSRALRRTFDKICNYLIWVMLAYVFGKAFGNPFGIDLLPLIMLLVVYGIELESIYVNYFTSKGKKIKINIFKFFSKKVDIIEVEEKDNDNK